MRQIKVSYAKVYMIWIFNNLITHVQNAFNDLRSSNIGFFYVTTFGGFKLVHIVYL